MANLAVLEERVNNHIRFFWGVAGVFLAWLVAITGFLYSVNSKIDRIPAALSSQLIEQSRQLISEKKNEDALRALSLATTLIRTAQTQRTKATDAYFNETTKQLQQLIEQSPDLHGSARGALIQLATYKSTLEQLPSVSGPQKSTEAPVTDPSAWGGAKVIRVLVHGDMMTPSFEVSLSLGTGIYGPVVFIGDVPDASQTLDGIRWVDVTFVNMKIKYHGGRLYLKNVRFVNCTFEFPDSQKGNQMIATIATQAALTAS